MVKKKKSKRKKYWKVSYKDIVVKLPYNPRSGICESCGRKMNTARHHWKYLYEEEAVKENPELALDCTCEYCFPGHKLADVLRKWFIGKGVEKTVKIVRKMFDDFERVTSNP